MFDWRVEQVRAGSASYLALELGHGVQGGVVELDGEPAAWLPYVEVADIADATERAPHLGSRRPARATRGPGRLAQRAHRARRGPDRAVATEALTDAQPTLVEDGRMRKVIVTNVVSLVAQRADIPVTAVAATAKNTISPWRERHGHR